MNAMRPLLEVKNLRTTVRARGATIRAVDGATFDVARGEALGLVGESGSGKSMTCQTIVRVEPRPAATIDAGEVLLDGDDLLRKPLSAMEAIRGARIGMILQDPLDSLNPVVSIGDQVVESLRLSDSKAGKRELAERAIVALERVGIARAAERLGAFPFEFSGGMCQRVNAAIAMAREPELLIADEPTTALDVTSQARFLDLLDGLRREKAMALLLVTHDLGIVAETCDRVAVMYAGRVVEIGRTRELIDAPRHPYTQALLNAVPHVDGPRRKRLCFIPGEPPSVSAPTVGCRYAPRCAYASERCRTSYPPTVRYAGGDAVACWLHVTDAEAATTASVA